MEPKGSLPCSQEPATSPCPESDDPSAYLSILFSQDLFQYYPPSMSRSSSWCLPQGILIKILYVFLTSPMHATCLTNFIQVHKFWSFSLLNLLQTPTTSVFTVNNVDLNLSKWVLHDYSSWGDYCFVQEISTWHKILILFGSETLFEILSSMVNIQWNTKKNNL